MAKPRALFSAIVSPNEAITYGTDASGRDYIALTGATVITAFETLERTVMCFGGIAAQIARNLESAPGREIELMLYHSGAVLAVDDSSADAMKLCA